MRESRRRNTDSARRPTVKDVAERAGVSVATVSRAMNGFKSVDPVLEAQVLRAVEELGYRRDGMARGLRRQVNTVLGMLVPDIENPFFTSVVRGAEDAAYEAGFLLMLCNTDEDVQKESAYMDVLLGQSVAGLLLVAADEQNTDVQALVDWGTPIVSVDRRVRNSDIDTVLVDNVAGASQAVDYLIAHQRSVIGTIAGPERTTTGLERFEGYRQGLRHAGLPFREDLVARGDFHVEGGYDAAIELLDRVPRPDAIFIANNQMAQGAINALHQREIHVPEDISIVCFDELPTGMRWRDAIATIQQPAYDMGTFAASILLRRIAGEQLPVSQIRLRPTLYDPAAETAVKSSLVAPVHPIVTATQPANRPALRKRARG